MSSFPASFPGTAPVAFNSGSVHQEKAPVIVCPNICTIMYVLENDIVMSSSLFMLITYYSVLTDTNERD